MESRRTSQFVSTISCGSLRRPQLRNSQTHVDCRLQSTQSAIRRSYPVSRATVVLHTTFYFQQQEALNCARHHKRTRAHRWSARPESEPRGRPPAPAPAPLPPPGSSGCAPPAGQPPLAAAGCGQREACISLTVQATPMGIAAGASGYIYREYAHAVAVSMLEQSPAHAE